MWPSQSEMTAARRGTNLWLAGIVLLLAIGPAGLAAACSRGPTAPSTSSSLSVGQWSGTTAQGAAITFDVASDEILTAISVGYNFSGCTGTRVFSSLHVATAPDVTCIPGPCSGTISSYRAFAYSDGTRGSGPTTTLNGVFLPGGRAQGLAAFNDYPGCGTAASVEWSATRR
jgi:hypothetical protein